MKIYLNKSFLLLASSVLFLALPASAKNLFCKAFFSRSLVSSPNHKSYTAGINEVAPMLKAAEGIRAQSKIRNDNTLHVAELVPLAEKIVTFMEADFKTLPLLKKSFGQKKFITALKNELAQRIESKSLTYHWLFTFSFRASILTDREPGNDALAKRYRNPTEEFNWSTYEGSTKMIENNEIAERAVSEFRDKDLYVLPITGDLGIFAINRLSSSGVAPLGHISGKIVADDRLYYSLGFWRHDIGHLINFAYANSEFRVYAKKFLSLAEKLPMEERMMAEFYFFYASHEFAILYTHSNSRVEEMRNRLDVHYQMLVDKAQSPTNLGHALEAAGINEKDREAVNQWLQRAKEKFLELHAKIRLG